MDQLSLIAEEDLQRSQAEWCSDDWETPDDIAKLMAKLVLPTDKRILEPAAGTGQIIKALFQENPRLDWLWGFEVNYERIDCQIKVGGLMSQLSKVWDVQHYSFLKAFDVCRPDLYVSDSADQSAYFDLIITNPPFSLAVEFIAEGLRWLNPSNPTARLLYLLPTDFFQSVERGNQFKALGCHIHHKYLIQNRVAYIKNGQQIKGRQIYDAVYDIRFGKDNGHVTFLN